MNRTNTLNPLPAIAPVVERDYINSPFYAHAQMESELQRAVSQSSEGTESSGTTIKWNETKDLHFRMVHGAAAAIEGKIGGDGRWERMSGGGSLPPGQHHHLSRREAFFKNLVGLFSKASMAAQSAVNGTYDEFTFTDFSPKLFSMVRTHCNIQADTYASSFTTTTNENFSEGRSGAFMFCSADSKYIVKTTTKTEIASLLRILPNYIDHIRRNPHSLLTKFLGAHCITMYSTKLYFVVMLNVFPRDQLNEKFDLKGSWVNRFSNSGSKLTRRERLYRSAEVRSVPLYLDNDLQQKIVLRDDVTKALRRQIRTDTAFLSGESNFFLDFGCSSLVIV